MFKRQTRPGWMAVVLQPTGVRVAHVVRGRTGPPRLALLGRYDRSGTETEDLSKLRRTLSLQQHSCTTAADASAYQIVQLNAPAVPASEMNAALRWSVKDSLDFPVDDALIDAFDVPTDGAPIGRARLVLAVAARRERIAARIQAFQRSGVPLAVIDIAEAAQRNLAHLFEQPDRALAFLTFDETGGLLTFTRNGELYAIRHIDATTKTLASSVPAPVREQLYERIALELQRSLDNFDRLFSQLALHRMLVGPFDGADRLITYLAANLAPPIEAANLSGVFGRDAGIEFGGSAEQAEWLRPLGLALREPLAA